MLAISANDVRDVYSIGVHVYICVYAHHSASDKYQQ